MTRLYFCGYNFSDFFLADDSFHADFADKRGFNTINKKTQ